MQKLNSEQLKELERLNARSLIILHFIGSKTPSDGINFVDKFKEVVVQTYNRKDLRGIKLLFKDVTEWAKGLSEDQISELNAILRTKYGED
jgi:hypothetical protein